MGTSNCENCVNFIYDDDWECYVCDMNLDEDEMMKFLSSSYDNCPYFQFYDEYKTVRKQN